MTPFKTPELVAQETGVVPAQQAYLNLIRTAQVLGAQLAELLLAHGLSGKQYNALRAIRRSGDQGAAVSTIAEQMTDPRADVTRLMDRLERDGLIARVHDGHDRRVVRVLLTEHAKKQLAAIDAPLVALHRSQFSHLPDNEIRTLIRLLKKVRGDE